MPRAKRSRQAAAVVEPPATLSLSLECPVYRSFHVEQLAGMFDLKLEEKLREKFTVEIPRPDEPWKIGLIVGPSGSGKTTLARKLYGKSFSGGFSWPEKAAVIDGFGDYSIKDIVQMLSAVGFSSPPSWCKPFAILSNGEKFRCELARALLQKASVVAFDEFTSLVDRTVAKIGSAAVAKAIRAGRIAGTAERFVAVTCHYDVAEWLEPDWVIDMASRRLARGSLRRPSIPLEIAPVHTSAWRLFSRHHYLSGNILRNAKCFAAFWDGEPVAFSAWIHAMTRCRKSGDMREHRTVVLPDYQGLGIGNRLSEFCASIFTALGGRSFSTTSHPAMIRYRAQSPRWKCRRLGMTSPAGESGLFGGAKNYEAHSCLRYTGGFQYVGPPMGKLQAMRMLSVKPRQF